MKSSLRSIVIAVLLNVALGASVPGQTPPAAEPPDLTALSDLQEELAIKEALAQREADAVRRLAESYEANPKDAVLLEQLRHREYKLHQHVSDAFDVKQKIEELEVRDLKARVAKLERQIAQRNEQREKIVGRRAEGLIAGLTNESSSKLRELPGTSRYDDRLTTRPSPRTADPAASSKKGATLDPSYRPLSATPRPTGKTPVPDATLVPEPEPSLAKRDIYGTLRYSIVHFEIRVAGESPNDEEVIYVQGVRVSEDGLVAIPMTRKLGQETACRVVGADNGKARIVAVDEKHHLALVKLEKNAITKVPGTATSNWFVCTTALPAKGQRLITYFDAAQPNSDGALQVTVLAVGLEYKAPAEGQDAFHVSQVEGQREIYYPASGRPVMVGNGFALGMSLPAGAPLMTLDGELQGIHLGMLSEWNPGVDASYNRNIPAVHIHKLLYTYQTELDKLRKNPSDATRP